MKNIDINAINATASNINDVLVPTKLIHSSYFSNRFSNNIFLKPENLQNTGSFKIRGAYNKIKSLKKTETKKGIICSSAGNHASGVAFSAKRLGIKATIVMPTITPLLKVQKVKELGANVVLFGDVYDDAYKKAKEISKEEGKTFIHPFDDFDVIMGQGTIATEIINDLSEVDAILVQIGGGGLISGIALTAKTINPKIKIIGVVAEGANSMDLSVKNKKLVKIDQVKTIAEGIAVKSPGKLTYEIVSKHVDDIITVSEKDIFENVLEVMEKEKLVVETAGAVSLAGLGKLRMKNKNIVAILSGGNIDMVTISSIINRGLVGRGRIMSFSVELPDKPGQLLNIAKILSKNNANVIELEHDQFKAVDRYSNRVVLEVTVETNGDEHIKKVIDALKEEGYVIDRIF